MEEPKKHQTTPLPIEAVVGDLKAALAEGTSAVVVAPPGAGKTTRLPLVLLAEPWMEGRKLLLLEPRRVAARAAAERMASLLGEKLGETVGLRARLDTRVSASTRIEVVTEGVFTRMILDDPSLDGVGAVLFDEFHERSLDADLGLAFALDARDAFNPALRIVVMSATLDAASVAGLIGTAPVLRSEGRAFPIETQHIGRVSGQRIEDAMSETIARAVRAETGSLLAFLPGQGEIRRTAERLNERINSADVDVVELHGGLDGRAQSRAIAPAPPGRRKIVLATSIAQTSITIEGVRIVVDSGLERIPRYEPDVGITRLETVRVSRATADQRRGRAGRTEPGVCYRLWDEPETAGLRPFTPPEILSADLAGLLLDCAAWGVTEPASLRWLDSPPAGALAAAREELRDLAALDDNGALTPTGRKIRTLPLPPRLARMVLDSAPAGNEQHAAEMAAIIVERGIGGLSPDIEDRLRGFERDRSPRAAGLMKLATAWADTARRAARDAPAASQDISTAHTLALAYPDRIAKARGARGQFLLANGRGAQIDATDPLAQAPFLVVADLAGAAQGARILLAARADEADIAAIAADHIVTSTELSFDAEAAAVRARRVRRLDAIVLASEPLSPPRDEATAALLAEGIARLGIQKLPWSKAQQQLCERVQFARNSDGAANTSDWPDVSDQHLAAKASSWLAPFIGGALRLADVTPDHIGQALDALVPYALRRRLDTDVPTHFEAPTGNAYPIDYASEGAPVLAIRVQELFGLKLHPAIAGGRRPLTLHLLSPAHRPIQITRDLPGFWRGSWAQVKAEMKGRYPKHVWPDDPANAAPTARAKPRGR